MFTGIIEELGEVVAVERGDDAARLTVRGPLAVTGVHIGDSIAVSGVCLTVVTAGDESFTADVMAQTLAMSSLDTVVAGRRVNLERAAQVGDRLGGHIVQGHVDGTATLRSITEGSAWRVLRFALPAALAPVVVDKGSIAVDGVSLTVSSLSEPATTDHWFEVSLIPETLAVTSLGSLAVGDVVNIETDILARHVERMLAFRTLSERDDAS
ncbi:riboflavin synthase alpha chain [Labedella gwakjiensis]|uniref:Riboflavin synthase n=1 Tax=Labedella gwakjiensis TaxID=390269 RepID=A0A2P8GXN5_9MICO|nr:riboflavin synthase [Labedella gwakjiensis]PSL38723.1 riboflavin synthase alpha chain [Labedella gwakjiensis]RUQ86787.1 riboflavin synthase [Labedella gwakjiensis]